jgi:DASS family divalent anion:Na+ symporter
MTRRWRLVVTAGVGALLWFSPVPEGANPQGWRLLAIFAATILGMMVQAMEAGAVVLLALAAALFTRTLPLNAVLGGFANSTVWLIVSAFVFSQAVSSTGLGKRLAYGFIRRFGDRTLGLAYALTASELVIAPAVPANTARTGGILFPIISSIARVCGSHPGDTARRLGAFLMVNQFHATMILSAIFLTATTANPLAAGLAAQTAGVQITWASWGAAAIVPGLLSLAATPWLLYRLYPPEKKDSPEAAAEAARQLKELGPISRAEAVLGVVVGACLALWATTPWHGFEPTAVAFMGIGTMLLAAVMSWQDVVGTRGAWDAMLWFGGLFAMAEGLTRMGIPSWFAQAVGAHLTGDWWWVLLGLSLAYFYGHYVFASTTAHVSAMYAPFLAVAISAGAPALLTALLLGFFSSLNAAITHYSTGPAAIYFGAHYVEQGAWWKLGFVVSVLHLVVWLGLGLPYWKLIGVW